ncbi:hypothetical protein CEXT_27701 [Caerostris extrusa]|uniref:Uncharacterized protein n=1 Tax=Caerostris extrusa TaxID=172846 RepID=A0AAV4VA38_CAEEX|nr:hypothetical protein CEXT_27701 [Caerostris extrusa]
MTVTCTTFISLVDDMSAVTVEILPMGTLMIFIGKKKILHNTKNSNCRGRPYLSYLRPGESPFLVIGMDSTTMLIHRGELKCNPIKRPFGVVVSGAYMSISSYLHKLQSGFCEDSDLLRQHIIVKRGK